MYEKLIEALREGVRGYGSSFAPAHLGDLRRMLAGIADRLEAAEESTGDSCSPPVASGECVPSPDWHTFTFQDGSWTFLPPAFPDGSTFKAASLDGESLDVTVSVSKGSTDAAEPSDDDEPLTVEWLEAAQPDGRIWKGCQWFEWTVSPGGCGIFMGCKVRDGLTSRWQLHVRTRGDYRELRRLLGVPLEGG